MKAGTAVDPKVSPDCGRWDKCPIQVNSYFRRADHLAKQAVKRIVLDMGNVYLRKH